MGEETLAEEIQGIIDWIEHLKGREQIGLSGHFITLAAEVLQQAKEEAEGDQC